MDYSNSLGTAKLPLRAIAARLEFRSTTLQDAPTGPEHVATVVQAQTAREQRDVQRTMEHWRRNTWGPDCIPLLDTFDFSPMRGDWGYRFLICGDGTPENAVFVTYGPKLAQLLGLPERAVVARPFVEQIPESYRSTFVEGYRKAVMEMVPVTLKGTFSVSSTFELFRAVFLPIMLQPTWSKQLVFGSFNCRVVVGR
jgi:hypothetical protein